MQNHGLELIKISTIVDGNGDPLLPYCLELIKISTIVDKDNSVSCDTRLELIKISTIVDRWGHGYRCLV